MNKLLAKPASTMLLPPEVEFCKKYNKIPCLKSNNGIHIWIIDLKQYQSCDIQSFYTLLNTKEKEKVQRLLYKREACILVKAILRILVGFYLKLPAQKVIFSYNPFGKPYIAENTLQFNLSHSGSYVIYAFQLDKAIGIDIEQASDNNLLDAIVERYFTYNEKNKWNTLPLDLKPAAFFRAWTRKEAYLKAIGTGLKSSLQSVEVSFLATEVPMLYAVEGSNENAKTWKVFSRSLEKDYTIAIVTQLITEAVHYFYDPDLHSIISII